MCLPQPCKRQRARVQYAYLAWDATESYHIQLLRVVEALYSDQWCFFVTLLCFYLQLYFWLLEWTATVPYFALLSLIFCEKIRNFLQCWLFIFKQFWSLIWGLFLLRWVPHILRFKLNRIKQLNITLKAGNQQPQLGSIHYLGDLVDFRTLFDFLRALILPRKLIHQYIVIEAALLIDPGWLSGQAHEQVTWNFVDAHIDTHRHELVIGVYFVAGNVRKWLYVAANDGVNRYLWNERKHNQVPRFKVRKTDRVGLMMCYRAFTSGLFRNHFLYWYWLLLVIFKLPLWV